jgi:hypothetical protein
VRSNRELLLRGLSDRPVADLTDSRTALDKLAPSKPWDFVAGMLGASRLVYLQAAPAEFRVR